MGYYLRFIICDDQPVTLSMLKTGLQALDTAYRVVDSQIANNADLFYGESICGQIDINFPDDDIFEDDLSELKLLVEGGESAVEQRILAMLEKARAIIAVEAIWEGADSEDILEKIDPLWDWLFDHYDGLLQADNEGFFDSEQLILPLDFKL